MSKKFSKIISIITAVFMLLTVFVVPISASATENTVIKWAEGMSDGCIWFYTSTCTITDWSGDNIVIPETINGVEVKNINPSFFEWNYVESITVDENNKYFSSQNGVLYNKDKSELIRFPSVNNPQKTFSVPNSVIRIGDYAFHDARITNITIPNSVVNIGEYAFFCCYFLEEISMPDSIINIEDNAFDSCISLKTVRLSQKLERIGEYAFLDCGELVEINFPDSLNVIGSYAFESCNSIEEIFIPANVETIGTNAFLQYEHHGYVYGGNLSYITVDENNKYYSSENGVLYNKDKTALLLYPKANERKEFTVPKGVKKIEFLAFGGCRLYNIYFPSSLKTIGMSAFADSTHLTNIDLPKGLVTIEDFAFATYGTSIKLTIPRSVTYIGTDFLSGEIYGYLGSYAEKYANEHNYSFIALDGVSENDLYSSHAQYLKNESYRNMCGRLWDDAYNIIYSRSDKEYNKYALKTFFKSDVWGNVKKIFSGLTGTFTEEKELEKQVARDLVYAVSQNNKVSDKVMSDVKDAFDIAQGTNSTLDFIMENGFKNSGSKVSAAKALSGGLFNFNDAYALIESVEKNSGNIEKHLAGAEVIVDAADIAVNIAMSMEADSKVVNTMKNGIKDNHSDSPLYYGLSELQKIQKKSVEENAWDELLKYGLDKIGGAIVSALSGLFAPFEFAFHIVGTCMPNPGIETVDKLVISLRNTEDIWRAKENTMLEMAVSYRDGKPYDEELACEYAILYTAYLESIKASVEYALEIAKPGEKQALQAHYNQYKDYLTYEKYIQSCRANANAQWKYSESNGEIKVTGLIGSSVETASNEHVVTELFVTPVYATGEDNENIIMDIPDEIDGMKVVAVSDNAFKDNTSIECISIPEETSSIGDSSFSGCTALHTVFLNEKLTSVGNEAFNGCSKLKEIEIPYSVNEIGENAFSDINDISIKAADGSAASQYANDNANATLESVDLKTTSVSITELPDKLLYKMSEDIDSTGIKAVAILEDGSEKDVSNEVICEFVDKRIGTNTINVYYGDVTATYEVEVAADKCEFTIYYVNEYGEEIAAPVSGTAMAGEEIALEIKDIKGYIPDDPSQTAVIGDNNEFVVTYTSVPDVDIKDAVISEIKPQSYTGKQIKPQVSVKYEDDVLVKDKDYYLEYGENVNAGTGIVTIIGTGEYTGIKEIEFKISKASITSKDVKIAYSNYSYTRKQIKPVPTVTVNGKKLAKDKDYTLSYGTNKYPGYGSVKVTGKGNYAGVITKKFTIAKVTGLKASSTGTNSIKLSWTKQPNVKGYKVYRLTGGKYKLIKTISGSKYTSYTVKNLSAGSGQKFKVRTYVGSKPYYGEYSSVLSTPTKPGKVTLSKLKTGRTHYVKATWKKKTGTGYQVKIATNSKFTKNAKTYKVTSYKTTSKTIKKLKKGKTYYVKVRAYKTYGGKTQYGSWSKYKKIKCK